jgi:predicted Zn-dependent peptidase
MSSAETLSEEQLNGSASWTVREKTGLTNDLNFMVNMIMEHNQYVFNLIAAVNVQQTILLENKLITEADLQTKITEEVEKMRQELLKSKASSEDQTPKPAPENS